MHDILSHLTAEEKLVLFLCKPDFSNAEKERIKVLVRQVKDWEEFIRIANEHGVIALSWFNIVQTDNKDLVPKDSLEILYSGYLKSLVRNTAIFELLKEVLEISAKEKIRIVLLKGLALEKTVYGNKGLRQMNDLDILVRREDAIRLRRLLLKTGFESAPMISPLHEKILPHYGKHLPEMYKNGLSVEVHFKLFDAPEEELTKLIIDTALPYTINYLEVYNPAPHLHFLYLVKHLLSHEQKGSSQMRLYSDLIHMLTNYRQEILTKELPGNAELAGISPFLAQKLFLMKTFFDYDTNNTDYSSEFPWNKDVLTEIFIESIRNAGSDDGKEERDSLLKPLKGMKKTNDKILFVIGYIFPSIEFMKFRYSAKTDFAAFIFYPVRWLRLLRMIISGRL